MSSRELVAVERVQLLRAVDDINRGCALLEAASIILEQMGSGRDEGELLALNALGTTLNNATGIFDGVAAKLDAIRKTANGA